MQANTFTETFKTRSLPLIGAVMLAACAPMGPAKSPDAVTATATAPAALAPAPTERVAFTWSAIGAQIYECRTSEKGGMAWAFVAPEAELLNAKNEKTGTHGAGPFWAAPDGSRIVGTVKARADGLTAADIPLLLLSARSDAGAGKMASVTSVQRLNTKGGTAPAKGCEIASDAGKRVNVGYTADYVFFTAR